MAEAQRNIRPRRRPPAYTGAPMTMTWLETAAELRVTESWLRDHLCDLPDFPNPDPLLDTFAREAVEAWVRRRFGLVSDQNTKADNEAVMLGRIGGKLKRALPGQAAA